MAWVTGQLPEQPRKHRNSALNSGVGATARTICSIKGQASPFRESSGCPDMRRISAPKFAFFLSVLAALFGCDEEREATLGPSEPWRREDDEKAHVTSFLHYEMMSGQALAFRLASKKASAEGLLPITGGSLTLDPGALETARGELAIDVGALSVKNEIHHRPPADDFPEGTEEPPPPPEDFHFNTVELKRWFGLGAEVSPEARKRNESAKFLFTSARGLSQPSAHLGGRTTGPGESSSEIRKVYVTAVGELTVGPFTVHREIPVTAEFHFSEPASRSSHPTQVEVTLRGAVAVPLSEYEIAPRDEAGRVRTDLLGLVGPVIGSSALISGKVTFLLRPSKGK